MLRVAGGALSTINCDAIFCLMFIVVGGQEMVLGSAVWVEKLCSKIT